MNSTLPPSRDLPAARHAEIRAAVLAEIAPRPAHRWLAPLVTAAAALVVVGLVTWFSPWRSDAPAGPPTVGSAQDVAVLEKECFEHAGPSGTYVVRQVMVAEADMVVLLDNGEAMMLCPSDALGYLAVRTGPRTAPVTFDLSMIRGVAGEPGHSVIFAGGLVSSDVAKVTFVWGEHSVDAELGNGTYLARLSYRNWADSENPPPPVVRAYDKNGTLLAEVAR